MDNENNRNNENNQLFRKKSLDAISSPESLNEYLKVTSPGVWFILIAVIVILAGVIVWSFMGHIDASTQVAVVSDNGEAVCMVPEAALSAVINDRTVTIDGTDYTLSPDVMSPETVSENTNVYVLLAGNLTAGDIVYEVAVDESLPDGVYSGKIITERLTPISFLLNN